MTHSSLENFSTSIREQLVMNSFSEMREITLTFLGGILIFAPTILLLFAIAYFQTIFTF